MPLFCFVFKCSGIDGDTARLLFGGLVNLPILQILGVLLTSQDLRDG